MGPENQKRFQGQLPVRLLCNTKYSRGKTFTVISKSFAVVAIQEYNYCCRHFAEKHFRIRNKLQKPQKVLSLEYLSKKLYL